MTAYKDSARSRVMVIDPTGDEATLLAMVRDPVVRVFWEALLESSFVVPVAAVESNNRNIQCLDVWECGRRYSAEVLPELFPDVKRANIENWPDEDKEAYCGGEYTVGYRRTVSE